MNHFAQGTEKATGSTIREVQSPFCEIPLGNLTLFNDPSSIKHCEINLPQSQFCNWSTSVRSTLNNVLTLVYRSVEHG